MPGSSANSLLCVMPVLHTFLSFVSLPSFILHQKIIIYPTVIIPYCLAITKYLIIVQAPKQHVFKVTTHLLSSVHGSKMPRPIHPLVCHDKTQGLFQPCADPGNPVIRGWQF